MLVASPRNQQILMFLWGFGILLEPLFAAI